MIEHKKKSVLLNTGTSELSKTLVNKIELSNIGLMQFPLIQLETILPNNQFLSSFGNEKYDLVILSSAKGVTSFFELLSYYFGNIYKPTDFSYAVVGSKTEAVLLNYGVKAVYTGSKGAKSLLTLLSDLNLADRKVFIPKSDTGLDILEEGLKPKVADLVSVNTYRNIPVSSAKFRTVLSAIDEVESYFIIFQSPSAVENYVRICEEIGRDKSKNVIGIGSIGSTTSKAIIECGLSVTIESRESTIEDLVLSVIEYLNKL